ncbi:unnamed protein product [Trifolium pratense]|uniref:Uncharacterized protein n=1 Tax=Trifolium pratense TaxID=57577 RepID=A0ACB0K0M2_TRIPR|nr:unnamed protein product [Trifolium pratense]
MGLSVKSPVQMQSLEEGCSKKRKYTETEKDLSRVMETDYLDSDYDAEEDALRRRKILDELFKTFQKNSEAIASCSKRKKPNCETNIDRPVARKKKNKKNKKKNERV